MQHCCRNFLKLWVMTAGERSYHECPKQACEKVTRKSAHLPYRRAQPQVGPVPRLQRASAQGEVLVSQWRECPDTCRVPSRQQQSVPGTFA